MYSKEIADRGRRQDWGLEKRENKEYVEVNRVREREGGRESNDINHVYCTFIWRADTLIHWALSDLCSGARKMLFLGIESQVCSAHYYIDLSAFVPH